MPTKDFLQNELDRVAAIVHGRHSHEGGPRAGQRKRLVMTRRIASIATDPSRPNSLLWNPAGTTLQEGLARLGVDGGTVAIIGGTEVFGLFLPDYDVFHLTKAPLAKIPGGRPVFPSVGPHRIPEDALADCGLEPGPPREIDAAERITLTTWTRKETAKTRTP